MPIEEILEKIAPLKSVVVANKEGIHVADVGDINTEFVETIAGMIATNMGSGDYLLETADFPPTDGSQDAANFITIEGNGGKAYLSLTGERVIGGFAELSAEDKACRDAMNRVSEYVSKNEDL
ncbi:hypothetical protein HOD83_01760 [Candidatus Woesearchaeota archaeon]|jgi:predicted regulator of Ras-like GTPase activity (Roadblock/LC7/MglB family)|nr:hypothetical protein [Candidatus Woesearchaeota archaeon]MBT4114431.1 hypothetical protein [Candidatus Woesearchaeota archaeon]MBT4248294.1 hypothetical protein [Candidatus Woesearchaeota archaeon]